MLFEFEPDKSNYTKNQTRDPAFSHGLSPVRGKLKPSSSTKIFAKKEEDASTDIFLNFEVYIQLSLLLK